MVIRVEVQSMSSPQKSPAEGTKDAEIAAKELKHRWYVAYVVAMYWMVSISMVYLNKICLNNEQASIKPSAPLFVTWYQCVITCLICTVFGNFGEQARRSGTKSMFSEFTVVWEILKPVAILSDDVNLNKSFSDFCRSKDLHFIEFSLGHGNSVGLSKT